MTRWLVWAGTEQVRAIEGYLASSDAGGKVTSVDSAQELRAMASGVWAGAEVVVGEGARGPAPINVAAAIAADGHAMGVTLVVAEASGSLRSRAKRAGIDRVLTHADLSARCPEMPCGAAGASPEAAGAAAERPAERMGHEDGRATSARAGSCEVALSVGASRSGEVAAREAPVAARQEDPPCTAGCAERREGVPVICLVSGRGGVGKSSACAVLAHIAAAWGMRVALLDLDLAFGNLYALLGLDRPADVSSLGEGVTTERVEACGREVARGITLLGPCAEPEYAELVQPHVAKIIAELTREHDLVLVDTTTNWGDAVASAVQEADRLVIVSDERPGAVSALVRCGALALRLGVARAKIVRCMNGCDPRGRDEAYVARAARGLECAREIRAADGGDEVSELLAAGHARELAVSANCFVASLATGLAQVLRELGALPECEAAQRALAPRKATRRLFRRREVA